ncbi:MAG TPA: CGNR zinc finger domain-containing protein [Candidatus Limnocylindrales bacterium]|nr:CGNR zinc finger domain-containing protein [Candidatus Limnocylindrales bacterium]
MLIQHPDDHEHNLDLEAALDFLNTRELDSGHLVDRLERPADARDWFVEQGVLHEEAAGTWRDPELDRVRHVRDALHEIVDAVVQERRPDTRAVDVVNDVLARGVVPHLDCDGTTVKIGHRHGASPVDDAVASLAAPIVDELATGRPDRFRICASDTCRWTFYDASPTGRRRWCNMKTCGNRAKAARHRARAASKASPAS